MTNDEYTEVLAARQRVGRIAFDGDKLKFCEGVACGELDAEQALRKVACAWNELDVILREIIDFSRDQRRLNAALREINAVAVDAMQGTARSAIPEDFAVHVGWAEGAKG